MMRRWRLSLKQRLLLLITVLMALLCVAGGVYIVARAQNDIRGEMHSATDLIERYLGAQLAVSEVAWRQNNDLLPRLELAQLRDVHHVQVSFYTNAGALAETSVDPRAKKLRAPRWFAWLVQRSFVPIPDSTQAVAFDGVRIGDIVIHPDPTYEMDEIWNVTRGLLGLLLVFFVLANALIWWAVVRAMRPIERVRDALQQLGSGNLHMRLPPFDLPELAGVSNEFNRMADRLEHSTAENLRLNQRLIQTQEDERARIAHELHDEIGQCITAIHADAAAIQRAAPGSDAVADRNDVGPDAARESAAAIVEAATQIKNLLRSMLQRLRPAALGELGLGAALTELVGSFRQRNADAACQFHIGSEVEGLDGDVAKTVYRLIQEGLTNITRHARAKNVGIDVRAAAMTQSGKVDTAQALRVTLTDDGAGFDSGVQTSGFGLLGMRERVQALGGELRIDSRPGAGTRIVAKLPFRADGAERE
ncbi:MAG TPA: HAMP domain-containing sensor histidine kinase [Rudaea sp.]|uniref:HAMP domain-containing sensor histidine kinase n=1 Tax=Rudaea sp. TaxID=2136325 RepID=UPI002F9435E9